MALILYCNGRDNEELPKSQLKMDVLQNIVGGYYERIQCVNADGSVTHVLYVNDEARLTGMPLNLTASAAARLNILGDCVLMTVEEEKEVKA